MMEFHHITALIVSTLGVWVARAYVPNLLASMTPPAKHLAWGFFFLAVGALGRSVYWAFLSVVGGEQMRALSAALGGMNVNILFELAVSGGLVLILRARLLAIPPEDRGQYNLFTCVTYPEPFRLGNLFAKGNR